MKFIREKLHAGGSLKPTGFLWPEDNEPAVVSFMTCLQLVHTSAAACLSQVWKWATGETVNQRWAGRNCKCLQAGMARGRGALFVPGGFSPLCEQWENREKEGGGKRPRPLWKKMIKEGGRDEEEVRGAK